MNDYRLCGWRVHSALPLPDLLPWTGPAIAPVDIRIDLGTVPMLAEELTYAGIMLQVGIGGDCRFAVPGVAVFRIGAAGDHIAIAPELVQTDPAIRAFLLGTVFAILCQRRGVLPLHACCIRLATPDGPVAIAFTAASGIGKSTLAAEFRAQGCAILADDVTVLDRQGMALPTFPRLKLWGDTLRRLDQPSQALERVRPGMEKFSLPLAKEFGTDPLPLAAIYHLSRVEDPRHAALHRIRGLAAVQPFLQALHQDRTLMRIAADPAQFAAAVTAVAARIPNHWRMAEPPGFDRLRLQVERLRGEYAAGGPP